ncbi:MAG TPA: helix-turn-helix domain-containing protein [Streptosporangiaceae bacterium]|nr:helix-turn-helix domain-containing protein [Streptosporangiaceae bacterium]
MKLGASASGRPAPGGTQSTQRLLALLDQFSTEQPTHTVEGLSEAIGLPRSTVYRPVSLLKAHELLEQAGDSRYRLGPHLGAGAKVLLAGSPAEMRERYIDQAVPPGQRDGLRAQLASIVVRGWAESRGEADPGIWAVAAPSQPAGVASSPLVCPARSV